MENLIYPHHHSCCLFYKIFCFKTSSDFYIKINAHNLNTYKVLKKYDKTICGPLSIFDKLLKTHDKTICGPLSIVDRILLCASIFRMLFNSSIFRYL